jgi:hypothetical protein
MQEALTVFSFRLVALGGSAQIGRKIRFVSTSRGQAQVAMRGPKASTARDVVHGVAVEASRGAGGCGAHLVDGALLCR